VTSNHQCRGPRAETGRLPRRGPQDTEGEGRFPLTQKRVPKDPFLLNSTCLKNRRTQKTKSRNEVSRRARYCIFVLLRRGLVATAADRHEEVGVERGKPLIEETTNDKYHCKPRANLHLQCSCEVQDWPLWQSATPDPRNLLQDSGGSLRAGVSRHHGRQCGGMLRVWQNATPRVRRPAQSRRRLREGGLRPGRPPGRGGDRRPSRRRSR
jgi:hypothetical protein